MVNHTLDALAIAPHPDDVEMCCGGTLAKLVSLGHKVGILDLTRGELASNGTPEGRAEESAQAAQVLGLTSRQNLGLADGFIANALSADSTDRGIDGPVAQLVSIIRSCTPTIIFGPSAASRHPDHVATARLVERAVFFAGVKNYPCAVRSEPFRPKRVLRYMMRAGLRPDFVVDITSFHVDKQRAISCYGSQVRRDSLQVPTLANAPLSHSALEARDAVFGGLIGVSYAEGFTLDGTVHIEDPISHFLTAQPAVLFQSEEERR